MVTLQVEPVHIRLFSSMSHEYPSPSEHEQAFQIDDSKKLAII